MDKQDNMGERDKDLLNIGEIIVCKDKGKIKWIYKNSSS